MPPEFLPRMPGFGGGTDEESVGSTETPSPATYAGPGPTPFGDSCCDAQVLPCGSVRTFPGRAPEPDRGRGDAQTRDVRAAGAAVGRRAPARCPAAPGRPRRHAADARLRGRLEGRVRAALARPPRGHAGALPRPFRPRRQHPRARTADPPPVRRPQAAAGVVR